MFKKLTMPLLLLMTGCAAPMDYWFSPNFNIEKGQFEHPEGDKSDKSIFDLFGLAFESVSYTHLTLPTIYSV